MNRVNLQLLSLFLLRIFYFWLPDWPGSKKTNNAYTHTRIWHSLRSMSFRSHIIHSEFAVLPTAARIFLCACLCECDVCHTFLRCSCALKRRDWLISLRASWSKNNRRTYLKRVWNYVTNIRIDLAEFHFSLREAFRNLPNTFSEMNKTDPIPKNTRSHPLEKTKMRDNKLSISV
jgi:hypothetical protein